MHDTHALRTARETEPDPYCRRFPFPKWTRTVTVLDEHRLFARLPEFATFTRADHACVSRDYLDQAIANRRVYADLRARYVRQYGEHGPLIAGGFYDDWPDFAKNAMRQISHRTTTWFTVSAAHWRAAGRTRATWQRLADTLDR